MKQFPKMDLSICLKCKEKIDEICHFKIYKCNHIFCGECLCNYLTDFSSAKIPCPFLGCTQFIQGSIVRKCLSKAEIEKYDQLCYPSNAVKCLSKECNYFVAHENNEGHFICPVCEQPNCITCSNYHSENEPCGISLKKKFYESRASLKLKEKRRSDLLELAKTQFVIKNPEKSNCGNCDTFLLPKEGRQFSDCLHNFCSECLKEFANNVENIFRLKCLICDTYLANPECRELLGDDKLEALSLKAVVFKFYHCSTPDCPSFWDTGIFTGLHKCDKCHKYNCISCNEIHEGQTCYEYKTSERYRKRQSEEQQMIRQGAIYCFNCNVRIIRTGGCGALKCSNCDKQICAYSGKELGPNGCQCRNDERCHPECDPGCIPEGDSQYEEDLRNYFYGTESDEEEDLSTDNSLNLCLL